MKLEPNTRATINLRRRRGKCPKCSGKWGIVHQNNVFDSYVVLFIQCADCGHFYYYRERLPLNHPNPD